MKTYWDISERMSVAPAPTTTTKKEEQDDVGF